MIRSFSYAAYAELVTFSARGRTDYSAIEMWARLWQQSTASAFIKSYLNMAGNAPFLPSDKTVLIQLLECMLLDKALYELQYELNNRPDWVWIPLAGILGLIAD
jgi:maltose alpha-D-glucosyltransferase/alpha-amylase